MHVVRGDGAGAMQLLQRALPLARASVIAKHLLHRVFGTMVQAATNPVEAWAIVDRAESTLGWDDGCAFCSIMLTVPATIACAHAGDVPNARRFLTLASASATLWQGTSWEAGVAEARAAVEAADSDPDAARGWLRVAADQFQQAGQPLDAERCRRLLATAAVSAPA